MGAYFKLTGERPAITNNNKGWQTRKQKEIFELVQTLFFELHIDGNSEYYAVEAVLNFSDNTNRKSGA